MTRLQLSACAASALLLIAAHVPAADHERWLLEATDADVLLELNAEGFLLRAADAKRTLQVVRNGPLPLRSVLDSEGDTAGADFEDLPRPSESRRILSLRVLGQPYGLVSYQLRATPIRAQQQYAALLQQAGYREPAPGGAVTPRIFERDAAQYLVHAFASGETTVISALRLSGPALHPQREAMPRVD